MSKIKRINPEDRENLVAYLDGELDDDSTLRVDAILSDSQVARHEVEMLTRTWEMLDMIPQEHASADFTQTTLDNVRQAEATSPGVTTEQVIPYLRLALGVSAWLSGVIAASWLGFMVTRAWSPNPAEELIRDLPVVENLHLYQKLDLEDQEMIVLLQEIEKRKLLDVHP
jgi:anti-sigma factor RsiW